MDWYIGVLKKYVEFSGRARRKEYWMFFLINFIIALGLAVVDVMVLGSSNADDPSIGMLSFIYSLAVLLPSIAVTIRRLHDTDRTGWWLLICFIPAIGAIVLLIFMVLDGTAGNNEYGPNPKAAAA